MHILLPETDNCPSWIRGRERMTVANISWSISTKEFCGPQRGSNPWSPGLQSDAHQTEPPRRQFMVIFLYNPNILVWTHMTIFLYNLYIFVWIHMIIFLYNLYIFLTLMVCSCWGFMVQSTQWGHIKRSQFTKPHFYLAGLVLHGVNQHCAHSFPRN